MKNNINEKLEDKSAKKAELEKQWFSRFYECLRWNQSSEWSNYEC